MDNIQAFRSRPKDYHEEAAVCDPDALTEIIRSRRSIRRFTDEVIPPAVMQACLDLALQAPNSSNLQTWEFHWVRTPGLKKALAAACLGQAAATTAGELIVCLARTQTWRRNAKLVEQQLKTDGLPTRSTLAYYNRLVHWVYTVGPLSVLAPFKYMLFTLLGWFRPIIRSPLTAKDQAIWAIKSAALACENLMLGLRAYGYDSCAMEGFDARRVAKILKLPRDGHIVMVIGAGRRAKGGVYGPKLRLPREFFVFER
ncbi:MAG: nitroreductase family protein [Pseudobdellovibrionaceae bacterium]|nr:nitroreductase family protein [Pseudobdellovibrionaceae bacterium]